MSAATEFDLGPLIWVRGEIDLALARTAEALRHFSDDPGATAQLKFAHTHLHQAHGALAIVGLDGVTRVSEALQALLDQIGSGSVANSPAIMDLGLQAVSALRQYLDELAAGAPDQPLRLLPIYQQLQRARGGPAAGPSDLFFPDLTLRPPRRPHEASPLPPDQAAIQVKSARTRFQRGLLQWLRSADGLAGLADMRGAIAAVEGQQTTPSERSLWWIALGFLDVLEARAVTVDATVSRLCARIDAQLRQMADGNPAPAEQLLRDLLYYIAIAPASTAQMRQIKDAYRLDAIVPASSVVTDLTPLKPVLLSLRETLQQAKDAWNRFCAGAAVALPQFDDQVAHIASRAAGLSHPGVARLLGAIHETSRWLRKDPLQHNDAVAMELATALLLADNAVENFARLDEAFPHQVEIVDLRLAALRRGETLAAQDLPMLGEMSHLAQEKLLLAQVVREIQTNLGHIEQTLDGYFRDPSRHAELAQLSVPIMQVNGALAMLGQDRAAALLRESAQQVAAFASATATPGQAEFQDVAHKLSGLGFFVEALQHGPADLDAILYPERAKQRRTGIAAAAESPAPAGAIATPGRTVAIAAPPSVAPTPQPPSKAPAAEEGVDQELLGIFIEEAREVLDAIAAGLAASRSEPHNHEILTTIRRGFHTLKGSGRMVGLKDLGEAAWSAEQVLNHWLQQELDATAALHAFIAQAHELMDAWAKQLDAGGSAHRDASSLIALARTLLASAETEQAAPPAPEQAEPPVAELAVEDLELEYLAAEEPAPEEGLEELPQTAVTELDEGVVAAATPPAEEEPAVAQDNRVRIGDVVLSRALYDMFLGEARQYLSTLRHDLARMHVNPRLQPGAETIRAAHTLKGISGTVGMHAVHDLAHSLENALNRLSAEGRAPNSDESDVLSSAASVLEGMVAAVANQRRPQPLPDLFGWLDGIAPTAVVAPAEVEELIALEEIEPAEPVLTPAEAMQIPVEVAVEAPAAVEPPAQPLAVAEALPSREAEAAEERRKMRLADDIDQQLLPIFLDEASDIMAEIGIETGKWHAAPEQPDAPRALARLLHTLKGSARMAGAMALGELVHGIESRIGQGLDGSGVTAAFLGDFDQSLDRVSTMLDRLRGVPVEAVTDAGTTTAIAPATGVPGATLDEEDGLVRATLRVRAELVDRFVNEAGEIAITRARVEGEMRNLRASLRDLTENVIRLRSQLREMEIQAESQMQSRLAKTESLQTEFDPLEMDRFTRLQELTRTMAESVNDVSTVQHNLLRNLDVADAALTAQGRLARELQQSLMNVRMVPFSSVADRLHRIVRQTAKELNRKANLDIRGGQLELDRSVLEKLTGPLEHLLRNAISHGLEERDLRLARGKREIGEVTLTLSREGNEIAVDCADDGGGLDLARIRRHAEQMGLLAPHAPADDATLMDMVFRPGFSTAKELSEVSGRGVGMDVVRNTIYGLGGRIEVSSTAGKGLHIRMFLPQSLVVMQALLARVAGRAYAIPSLMVDQAMELKLDALEKIRKAGQADWQGHQYPFRYLAPLLGDFDSVPQPARRAWVILAHAGSGRAAVQVDELRGIQEIVIKKTGAQLARVVGISGASVLADGEICLILNPVALLARAARRPESAQPDVSAPAVEQRRPTVMVVDDSLTVRKITGRLLEREGFHVMSAKDGVDALEQLLDTLPDVMLVDIEMPRMDGFDLSRNVRSDARLRHIPIIIITSRLAEKHRNYAREIGVNHYLGKPFQEDELLQLIRTYTAAAPASPA
jgi:chemosensory pili system protein ChpA (sensor histidine kinase/response regulator)